MRILEESVKVIENAWNSLNIHARVRYRGPLEEEESGIETDDFFLSPKPRV